jgi:GT2 family glycosyltransferase
VASQTSIIITTFNNKDDAIKLLASLDLASAVTTEVIIVDSGSFDGTPDLIEEDFPTVRVIRLPENRGWPAAANAGFKHALGQVVVFCHADIITTAHDLSELADRIREGEGKRLVAVVPRLVDASGEELQSVGAMPSLASGTVGMFKPSAARRREVPSLDHVPDHQWTVMACIAFDADVLVKLGGFDERFFLYYADVDLCERLHEKSYRIGIRPDVKVIHTGGETSDAPLSEAMTRIMRKDQQRYFEKHRPAWQQGVLKLIGKSAGE